MLIHELRVTVAAQENTEIIEPGDDPCSLTPLTRKIVSGVLLFSDVVQERVLKVLGAFCGHFCSPLFLLSLRTLELSSSDAKPKSQVSRLLLGVSTRAETSHSFKVSTNMRPASIGQHTDFTINLRREKSSQQTGEILSAGAVVISPGLPLAIGTPSIRERPA